MKRPLRITRRGRYALYGSICALGGYIGLAYGDMIAYWWI